MSTATTDTFTPVLEAHPRFRLLRRQPIESLGVEVAEYEHLVTGASHYHIAADHPENVFLVALRTVPEDSTGVAHILEHTALCGSERYPVRDPFFMMIRRSLNTFMNAFTSSDWTAYPFATQNRKDFFNLLDVYLDAVFFSRLDPLDFAQEGHRLEFKEPNNADSELTFKGVVYNEMKGAMSSPVSTLWQTLSKYLFPTTTYHHNSGGEPECIPDLSYEQLLAFYRTHYHPSNAVFMTFGDLPVAELQEKFENRALSRFQRLDETIAVGDEKRYQAPLRVEEAYALNDEDLSRKTHVVVGWLLGHSTNLEEQLEAHLLTQVLLDNSASPLRHALETTSLGQSPSPLCGLEESNREMSFMCGLEGTETADADAIEALIMETLRKVAEQGVPQSQVEAVLHQLELSQREIGGDGFPFGLQLIMSGLSTAMHRGDPIDLLNLDPVLEKLRARIQNPDYVKGLVQRLLLDNRHQVRLTLRPDGELSSRRDMAEALRLNGIRERLNAAEKQAIIDQARTLEERQQQVDDDSMLPKVGLSDVPADFSIPAGEFQELACGRRAFFGQATNGLIYQQVLVEMPALTEEEQLLLPYYTNCVTELGHGELDYQQAQALQSSVSGGINAYCSVRGDIDNEQSVKAYFTLSGKALVRNTQPLTELLFNTFNGLRFDELGHIRELVAQLRTRKEQSITGSGHSLAMLAATSSYSPAAYLSHQQRGLAGVRFAKELDSKLNDESALADFATKLSALHHKIIASPRHYLVVTEPEGREAADTALCGCWGASYAPDAFVPFTLPERREALQQAWTTSTQVNFCAKAYPTVTVEHPDAAPLTVLGGFLRNGYLHRTIREQGGAYGGGAGQDASNGAFRFYSYRDPRLEETLEDFDRALDWLLEEEHGFARLEEAILGVVSSIDKPGSPAGEAKQAYHSSLFGRTPEQRRRFRGRILEVSIDDLKRVVRQYLKDQPASVAVVTSAQRGEALKAKGMDIISV